VLIENSFTVARPLDEVWDYLLDVERITPCLPGAELTETIDDHTWKGMVNMKLGPVSMSFAGTVEMDERDPSSHRVVLRARGTEQKGKGAADAKVTSWLVPADGGTTVKMEADITLTGSAAQLSRGLLPEVSKRLTQQFVDCLEGNLGATPAAAAESTGEATTSAAPVAVKPVGGLRLGVAAIWGVIAGFFRRLFGGAKTER
jgi:uncharacterized protein